MRLRVVKYIPGGLYGFAQSSDGDTDRVFFHLTSFDPMGGPPPIVGENVEVTLDENSSPDRMRATRVERISLPVPRLGTVTRFDYNVGYGFLSEDSTGDQFFLHKSEMPEGNYPRVGMRVEFFAGDPIGKNRPRACYIRVMEDE